MLIPFGSVDPHAGKAAVARGPPAGDRARRPRVQVPPQPAGVRAERRAASTRSTRRCRSSACRRCSTPARPASAPACPAGAGSSCATPHPMLLDDVAADFPQLTIVLAHPSVPWQDEAISIATHKANVYIDLSGWSPKYFPPQLVRAANGAAQAQGAVRLGLPGHHPGPVARRLRRAGHQGRGPAADPQGERRADARAGLTAPACSGGRAGGVRSVTRTG